MTEFEKIALLTNEFERDQRISEYGYVEIYGSTELYAVFKGKVCELLDGDDWADLYGYHKGSVTEMIEHVYNNWSVYESEHTAGKLNPIEVRK